MRIFQFNEWILWLVYKEIEYFASLLVWLLRYDIWKLLNVTLVSKGEIKMIFFLSEINCSETHIDRNMTVDSQFMSTFGYAVIYGFKKKDQPQTDRGSL